jgi:hypothetical protein
MSEMKDDNFTENHKDLGEKQESTQKGDKENMVEWINKVALEDVSIIKTHNMLLAVELRDKLVAYKKWALLQIEQKAK